MTASWLSFIIVKRGETSYGKAAKFASRLNLSSYLGGNENTFFSLLAVVSPLYIWMYIYDTKLDEIRPNS